MNFRVFLHDNLHDRVVHDLDPVKQRSSHIHWLSYLVPRCTEMQSVVEICRQSLLVLSARLPNFCPYISDRQMQRRSRLPGRLRVRFGDVEITI